LIVELVDLAHRLDPVRNQVTWNEKKGRLTAI